MKTIQFILGLHNHQPVGNFDWVFQDAFEKSYQPFVNLLSRHPQVKAVLHHTGPLLEWMEKHQGRYLDQLARLAANGQVELLGGAFYEPILPVIPESDRVGQIQMMSEWMERRLGVRPRGMWLAERVWEPTLPQAIAAAGIEYTVLDDSHFKSVGVPEEDCLGYYLTEDQGAAVAVFPINERLRYTIPFHPQHETFDYLRSLASEHVARTAVMADDGEKFGVWPETFDHCYRRGWLEDFFRDLEKNADWVHMKTFSEVLDTTGPMGRTYLPAASYIEMMEWAMPSHSLMSYNQLVSELKARPDYQNRKTYVRGGFWRQFFSKYDESNHMHKKMLSVHRKLASLPAATRRTKTFKDAQNHLWQAQCNCAYWHGVFGGLYLTNLRTALYKQLIAAETICDALGYGAKNNASDYLEARIEDFDVDGGVELTVESPEQLLMFQPHRGGMLVEQDIRAINFNLLDTLQRRREYYHSRLLGEELAQGREQITRVKEQGLHEYLVFDWYRRGSLIDHFLGADTTVLDFRRAIYGEEGRFVNAPYSCQWKRDRYGISVSLAAQSIVDQGDQQWPVLVEKDIRCRGNKAGLTATYRVTNLGERLLTARFGVEFNVNLLAGHAPDRYHHISGHDLGDDNHMDSMGVLPNVSKFAVKDDWLKLRVEWKLSQPAEHWRLPIETVSSSESGVERLYQSSVLMPVWDIQLGVGETFEATIEQTVTTGS